MMPEPSAIQSQIAAAIDAITRKHGAWVAGTRLTAAYVLACEMRREGTVSSNTIAPDVTKLMNLYLKLFDCEER
jgi:hypothetical protein